MWPCRETCDIVRWCWIGLVVVVVSCGSFRLGCYLWKCVEPQGVDCTFLAHLWSRLLFDVRDVIRSGMFQLDDKKKKTNKKKTKQETMRFFFRVRSIDLSLFLGVVTAIGNAFIFHIHMLTDANDACRSNLLPEQNNSCSTWLKPSRVSGLKLSRSVSLVTCLGRANRLFTRGIATHCCRARRKNST